MSVIIGEPNESGLAQILGQAGAGIGQGLQSSLDKFYQQKQGIQSATNLANSLNLKGDERAQMIQLFSSIPAEKQPAALKALTEAQINQQALGFMHPGSSFDQGPPGSQAPSSPKQSAGEAFQDNIDEVREDGEQVTIEGVEWGKQELPPKTQQLPAIGPLAAQAKLQQKQNQFNQERNLKFADGYEDLTKLQENVDNVNEAIRIINEENLGGKARQFIRAIATQKNPNLDELIKTDAENKLYHLLYDFIRPKELGGSNPSTREVIMSLARLPSGAKGKEVSLYISENMRDHANRMLKKGQRINSLLSYDPYMNPGKFRSLADKPTKTSPPPPSTSKNITTEIAQAFLKEANGDKEKARKLARKRGYIF